MSPGLNGHQSQSTLARATISTFGLVAWILFAAVPASAQFPDTFTNLKFFPKDISSQELMQTMRGFSFALGTRCEHCHVQNSDGKFDFAADTKSPKQTARVMLRMVASVNRDFVGQIGKDNPVKVECATCHHGLTEPRQLKSVLEDSLDHKGLDATIAQYQELRKRYDATGAYDFSDTTLNLVTEWLMAQHRNKEAAAIMEMNFAANKTDSVWAYHLLAMAHEANGEKQKARDDFRRVVELHPDDSWAKQQLERLSARDR